MRRKLVVGNWKMHGRLKSNADILTAFKQKLSSLSRLDMAICIPYPYLFQAQALLSDSNLMWGAQNVSRYDEGAYTASISAQMIADFGCEFVIIGHSERRAVTHESHQSATQRFALALKAGITPIFCVGETLAERTWRQATSVVSNQIKAILDLDEATFSLAKERNAVIAYEPVWAIGTDQTASAQDAQEMHANIRAMIAERDASFAESIRIIYGGSITATNAQQLFAMPEVDGGLVGRSSLNVDAFYAICHACESDINSKTS